MASHVFLPLVKGESLQDEVPAEVVRGDGAQVGAGRDQEGRSPVSLDLVDVRLEVSDDHRVADLVDGVDEDADSASVCHVTHERLLVSDVTPKVVRYRLSHRLRFPLGPLNLPGRYVHHERPFWEGSYNMILRVESQEL